MSRVAALRKLLAAAPLLPLTCDVSREQADLGNGTIIDFFPVDVRDADGELVLHAQSEDDPSDFVALIVAAPEALRDLLDVYEAAQDYAEQCEAGNSVHAGAAYTNLRAALARWEAPDG